MTILVAEDNVANRELVQEMLELLGHKVIAVPDGEAAIKALDQGVPDLVVLDIQMPKLGGFQTVAALRNRAELTGVPVIALSGFAMEEDRQRALAHGFDGYLTKPILMPRLKEEISRVTGGKETRE